MGYCVEIGEGHGDSRYFALVACIYREAMRNLLHSSVNESIKLITESSHCKFDVLLEVVRGRDSVVYVGR